MGGPALQPIVAPRTLDIGARGRTIAAPAGIPARREEWAEEKAMPHYMFRASYTKEGMAGVLKEGAASRMEAVRKLAKSAGGSLETAYWAFGSDDFLAIVELPDNSAAAALATKVARSGTASISTTVLLTAEDMDAARGLDVSYRAPGT
jgi:uncharacterized protein with GYD domain